MKCLYIEIPNINPDRLIKRFLMFIFVICFNKSKKP